MSIAPQASATLVIYDASSERVGLPRGQSRIPPEVLSESNKNSFPLATRTIAQRKFLVHRQDSTVVDPDAASVGNNMVIIIQFRKESIFEEHVDC